MPTPMVAERRLIRSGFSLIETIIVLVLLGTLGALALPNIVRSGASTRVDRAAEAMVWDIQSAFSLASRQRQPVEIAIDVANRGYTIRDRGTATVLTHRELAKGNDYGVTAMSASANPITVFPNGLASAPFVIRLTVANEQRRVLVTKTGLIRVIKP